MKFKIKINKETSFNDIRNELENLKKANIKAIPLNHIRKITKFLEIEELSGKGSSIRFYHKLLIDHSYYRGYFQVHKIHKGGNIDEIRKSDFVKYLYPVLVVIIDLKA
jgi:hypothetical protein